MFATRIVFYIFAYDLPERFAIWNLSAVDGQIPSNNSKEGGAGGKISAGARLLESRALKRVLVGSDARF